MRSLPYLKAPVAFVWIGFVSAISFMEAWLKFTATGVTLKTGLAIGQIVFNALNKVELILSLSIFILLLLDYQHLFSDKNIAFFTALLILLVQTFLILPRLSERIDIFLSGETPKPSHLHSLYIFLEIVKVIFLLWFGLNEINKWINLHRSHSAQL